MARLARVYDIGCLSVVTKSQGLKLDFLEFDSVAVDLHLIVDSANVQKDHAYRDHRFD